MSIDIKLIKSNDSEYIGKNLWIAEVNFHMEKPRIIQPMLVRLRHCDEAPKNKNIYYSYTYFSPLGKTGEPLSRVIPIFDNTGYRASSGNPLTVFETEEEAKNWFIEKMGNVIIRRVQDREKMFESYDSVTQKYIDLHDEILGEKTINPKGEQIGKA